MWSSSKAKPGFFPYTRAALFIKDVLTPDLTAAPAALMLCTPLLESNRVDDSGRGSE
jgi:hypothetical protein